MVETTLAGRGAEIKGYTIAVEALGRPEDFDPVSDPIVRVEAGRLRRALEQYYAGEGAADPVRIEVARGGYVPVFLRTGEAAAPATLVVEPEPPRPAPPPPARPPGGKGLGRFLAVSGSPRWRSSPSWRS